MRSSSLAASALAVAGVACLFSCGAGGPTHGLVESTAVESAAIQGGSTDATHTFAVGIVQLAAVDQNMVSFCSGILLAPNLVATARHCVAQLTSSTIDCSQSTFGPLYPASDVVVTLETTIPNRPTVNEFKTVSKVLVPSGANQTAVCGNDIALLILDQNVTLPEYATPVIDPPMTDPSYGTVVTAIGYGVNAPTDTSGTTAGTRRSKQDVKLLCVPNDANFTDCFNDPQAKQILTAAEFVSGDSTCEGDSGSGAFEQSAFDQSRWVAYGVLSRGGVSDDGLTCVQPIYSRFDAWGPLIVDAAKQAVAAAAAAGQPYALATWAGGTGAITIDAGAMTTGSSTGLKDGTACSVSSDCQSARCALVGGNAGSVCASACQNDACASGFSCQGSICLPNGDEANASGGCSTAAAVPPGGAGTTSLSFTGLALAGLAGIRRRRRVVRRQGS